MARVNPGSPEEHVRELVGNRLEQVGIQLPAAVLADWLKNPRLSAEDVAGAGVMCEAIKRELSALGTAVSGREAKLAAVQGLLTAITEAYAAQSGKTKLLEALRDLVSPDGFARAVADGVRVNLTDSGKKLVVSGGG